VLIVPIKVGCMLGWQACSYIEGLSLFSLSLSLSDFCLAAINGVTFEEVQSVKVHSCS
jgi:hypothetical protein